MQMRVKRVQNPFHHRPGHDWKPRKEVDSALPGLAGKPRDLVERIWDDVAAHWEHAHVQAVNVVRAVFIKWHTLLFGSVFHSLGDQRFGLGVQRQVNAQRGGGALTGVVVGRGANTAA